ncbi:MAG TPA: DUF6599 family protein [Bryobacteraceae bacterium]|jgi:hypothetical protein
MLRSLSLLVLSSALVHAAIFPDQVGVFKKSAPKTMSAPDLDLDNEYGIQATESADYTAPDGSHFIATAWRFHDSTGAMAMFEARRPPGATPSKVSNLAVSTSDGVIFAYGNYLFQFTGGGPGEADLKQIYSLIPLFENSPLPLLYEALPPAGLIPNSERYILGPVSLQRFEPRIAPSVAAFHLGAEAQFGQYQTSKGPLKLLIFEYPTPNMARERFEEFEKIPGAVAKRLGSLVAITIQPPDPDAAERILAQIKYNANVTMNEMPPVEAKQVGGMLLSVIALAGILLGMCLIAGIGFGAFRVILRKLGWSTGEPEPMITLHLSNK